MRIASLALLGALIAFAGSESRAGFLEDYTNPLGHPGSLGSLVSPLNPLSPLSPMNPANQEEEHRRRRDSERRRDDGVPSVPEPKEVAPPKPPKPPKDLVVVDDPKIDGAPFLALTAEEVGPDFKGNRNALQIDRAEAACKLLGYEGLWFGGDSKNPYSSGFVEDRSGRALPTTAVTVGPDGKPSSASYAPMALSARKKSRFHIPFHHDDPMLQYGWMGYCIGGTCPVFVFTGLDCRKPS